MFCVILFRKGVLKMTDTNAEPRKERVYQAAEMALAI